MMSTKLRGSLIKFIVKIVFETGTKNNISKRSLVLSVSSVASIAGSLAQKSTVASVASIASVASALLHQSRVPTPKKALLQLLHQLHLLHQLCCINRGFPRQKKQKVPPPPLYPQRVSSYSIFNTYFLLLRPQFSTQHAEEDGAGAAG
jgi:hypothetical protein